MFQQVFLNNPEGRTKILVTHALHFLPQVDYIYTFADGQIMERGTYPELMANRGVFSKFVKQFGSKQQEEEKEDAEEIVSEVEVEKEGRGDGDPKVVAAPREQYEKGKTIMQEEERNIGAVTWKVYKTYLAAGNGHILVPALLLSILLLQVSQVMSSYWLVFWQERRFNQPSGFYVRGFVSPSLELLILVYFVRWAFMLFWESPLPSCSLSPERSSDLSRTSRRNPSIAEQSPPSCTPP